MKLFTLLCLPLLASAWLAAPFAGRTATVRATATTRFVAVSDGEDELDKAMLEIFGPKDGPVPAPAPAKEDAPAEEPAPAPSQ